MNAMFRDDASKPKVYLYSEADNPGEKARSPSTFLPFPPFFKEDEEGDHPEMEFWEGIGNGPGPDEDEGGGQFVYTFFYQQPHQQGKPSSKNSFNPNRARIAFPFSSIDGLVVDRHNLTLHVLLNQPPRTWVGTQVMSGEFGIHKGPTRWQRGQYDFSGGPVKRACVHSLKLANDKEYKRLSRKIASNSTLQSILWRPESQRLMQREGLAAAAELNFIAEEVAASMDVPLQLPIGNLQQDTQQQRPQQDGQEKQEELPDQGTWPSPRQTRSMLAAAAAATTAATAAAGLSGTSAVAPESASASPAKKKQRSAATPHQQAPPSVPANRAAGLAPGWLPQVPNLPEDSWALKCIRRWGLQPPFDSAATGEQWHLYHDERRALELVQEVSEQESAKPIDKHISRIDMNDLEFADVIKWHREGLQKPSVHSMCRVEGMVDTEMDGPQHWNGWDENMKVIRGTRQAVQHVLGGCNGIKGFKDLADRTARGTFILEHNGELLADENPPTPRTLGMYTRIYSPFCSPRALDIDFGWHLRPRNSWVDHFTYWFALTRDPSTAKPLKPQETALRHRKDMKGPIRGMVSLYEMDMEDDGIGFENRSPPTASNLDKVQRHLFGRSDFLSRCKFFNLLAKAGCSSHKVDMRSSWTSGHPVDYAKACKVVARSFPDLLPGESVKGEDPPDYYAVKHAERKAAAKGRGEEVHESTEEEEESEDSEVSENDDRRDRYLNWLARKGSAPYEKKRVPFLQHGEEGTDEEEEEEEEEEDEDDWESGQRRASWRDWCRSVPAMVGTMR